MTQTQQHNVPALRFPEFDEEWEISLLAEIAKKKISYGIVQAGPHVPDGMPYIKSKDLNDPLEIEQLERTSEKIAKKYKRSEVTPGDIVFSLRGNIGVSQIVPSTISVANLTQGTARISVEDGFSNLFIQKVLQTPKITKRVLAVSKGSTFQEISLFDLRKIAILHPTLPEQQKIASFLSQVDRKIAQLGEKKALLQAYKKGMMQKLFSQELRFKDPQGHDFPDWEEKRLGEVADKTASSISANSLKDSPGEYPVYGASGIAGYVDYYSSEIPHISVVKDGAGVGRLFFCPAKSSVLGTLESVVAKGGNNTRFIYYWMSKINFKAYTTGSTIPHIYFKDYGRKKDFLPYPEEQQKIADFLSSIDRKIDLVSSELDHAKTFKKGLLQQMFI